MSRSDVFHLHTWLLASWAPCGALFSFCLTNMTITREILELICAENGKVAIRLTFERPHGEKPGLPWNFYPLMWERHICMCIYTYINHWIIGVCFNQFPCCNKFNLGYGVTAWKVGEIHDIMAKHWHLLKKQKTISNYNLEYKPHVHIVLGIVVGKSWNIYMYWLLFIASSKVLHELTFLSLENEGERIQTKSLMEKLTASETQRRNKTQKDLKCKGPIRCLSWIKVLSLVAKIRYRVITSHPTVVDVLR